MDYNYIIEKTYRKASFFIIKKFREFYDEGRPFSHSIDKIRIYLCNNQIYKNNLGNNIGIFESCYHRFNHHEDYYKKGTPINKIIENEVKKEFENINTNKTLLDRNGSQIENYTFNKFIYDLIVYDTLKRIEGRLGNNSELYRVFYETNDYTHFTLEYFDQDVTKSKLYIMLTPKNKMKTSEVESLISDEKFSLSQNEFKTYEKSLLFYIMCSAIKNIKNSSDDFSLPFTELLRLVSIIDFKDDKSFTKKYRDSIHYKILSKGINHFPKSERLQVFNDILKKMESLNLKKTSNYINFLREKYNNQHQKK